MKRLLLLIGPCVSLACSGDPSDLKAPEASAPDLTRAASLHVTLAANSAPTLNSTAQGPKGQGQAVHGPRAASSLEKAIVLIDEVTAHIAGHGWVNLMTGDVVEVDVLALADHAVDLGFARIPPGRVTQVRLHVMKSSEPYVVTSEGKREPLKVPSGSQSGIKIIGPWDIGPCASATVALELEGRNAIHIHKTGHEDLWILRPVIRTRHVEVSGTCEDDEGDDDGSGGSDDGNGGGSDDGNGGGDPDDGNGGDPDDGNGGDPDDGNGGGSDDGSGGGSDDGNGGGSDDGNGGGSDDGNGGGSDDGSGGGSDDGNGGGSDDPKVPCTDSIECNTYSYCSENGFCELIPEM